MTRQVGDNLILNGELHKLLGAEILPENDARVVKLTDEEFKALFDDGDELRKQKLEKLKKDIQVKSDSHEKLTGKSYQLTTLEQDKLKLYTYLSPVHATSSTACRRGFISTWQIKDDRLYLNDIIGRYKLSTNVPVVADWYTDTLKVPTGKQLTNSFVTPLEDIYEEEIHLKIENGIVISSEIIDRRDEYEEKYGSLFIDGKPRADIIKRFLDL